MEETLDHNHGDARDKNFAEHLPASLRIQTLYNKSSRRAPAVPEFNDRMFPLVPVKYCKQPPGALESEKKN